MSLLPQSHNPAQLMSSNVLKISAIIDGIGKSILDIGTYDGTERTLESETKES